MQTLWQDLRYGARMLMKKPGFTLIAVLTLALGIGANTAIFSVVNAVLLQPLPYREAERLIVLRQQASRAGATDLRFSVPELGDYRQQNQTLAGIEEYHADAFVLFGLDEPVRVQTGVVSAGFFDLLGLRPALGRSFSPDDDQPGSEPVLLLSHDFWQRRFSGDSGVIGRSFQLSGASHAQGRVFTVIGVLPPAAPFPARDDVYMPAGASPFRSSAALRADRQTRRLQLVARLKPGVTPEQVQADLTTISNRLQQSFPEAYSPAAGFRISLAPLPEELTRQARPALALLLASVALVLLLVCANVANLTLARLLKREKELAIRAALGASRVRLIRQLLTESVLLALLGGALGLLAAWWGMDLLAAYVARLTPRAAEIELDGTVLLFALFLSLLTGMLAGVFPAWPAWRSRQELTAALNESRKTSLGVEKRLLRGALVVAQVAISIVLLVGTGLLARSLINLYRVDSGFDATNVLTARVTLNPSKFEGDAQQVAFFNAVLEKINAHPEVISSAVTASVPLQQARSVSRGFLIENRRAEEGHPRPAADLYVGSPWYFKTLGIPVLRGRAFEERDQADALGVAVINQSMARYYWGDEDPVGRRISLDRGESWLTVIGVAGNVRQLGLDKEAAHQVFRPYAQFSVGNLILVRTRANPLNIARHIQTAIAAVDPQLPVDQVRTLEQIRSDSIASPRLTAALVGLFAALALAICAAGIAGVTALTVSQRTREIGIRIALGAGSRDILKLIIRREMAQALIGAVLGLASAWALSRSLSSWLSGLLFEVRATDPLTFVLIVALLSGVALLACYIPARRATKLDPMVALRHD